MMGEGIGKYKQKGRIGGKSSEKISKVPFQCKLPHRLPHSQCPAPLVYPRRDPILTSGLLLGALGEG